MSFEVGRLSAALTLDGVSEFHGQLDAAGRKLAETGQRGASFGRAAETAVRTAAGATTGLVAAGGAYLTMLTRTGVAYNSLQQNSRAALKVIMGGTQQANEQMSKLDDFARNSPFSKSVFIQAQQQLLGFGMEAKKVIPTLNAVQQSMAAMGRGNEDITEVVNILANVQSTGKLTAETLNQLGYRGLDAAELIGKGMSKTGNQIKESITKGTLDGREALDVLVTQMQKRFGGAADGVKEQWSGATDRIKAATRDLGAHIAEPFVSAEGGGMAVKWGNQVADVLRAIEKQSIPVMGILTQRGAPLFAGLTRDLDAAKMAIARWNPASLELSLDKLASHAPGLAATGAALLALGGQVGPLGKFLSMLGLSVNPVLAAFVGLAAASPELRSALGDLLTAGKPLLPLVGELARAISGVLNAALPVASSGVSALAGALTPLLQVVAQIPAPILAGAAAFMAVHQASKALAGPLGAVQLAFQQIIQRGAVQAALGNTSQGMGLIASTSMAAQGAVRGLGNALKTAFLSNPIGIALTAVATAVGLWAQANADAQAKVQAHESRVAELRGTLDKTTGSLTDASREMVAQAASTDEMAKKLQDAGTSGQAFTRALTEGGAVAKVFRDELVQSTTQSMKNEANLRSVGSVAKDLGLSYNEVVESMLGFKDSSEKVETASKKLSGDAYIEMQQRLAQMKDNWKNEASAQREVVTAYEEQRAAIEGAQREQARLREATRQASAEMSDAARSNQRFNDALAVARDTTADAETRVRALKQALDELKGGSISAEEATVRLNETALALKEGLAQTDQAGKKLWKATLDGKGVIDTTSRAGIDFQRAMSSSRDAMLDAARAASDKAIADGDVSGAMQAAQSAGQGYIDSLREQMKAAGLTQGQIDGLVGKYLDIPAVVATLLTDNGTFSEADKKVLELLSKLSQLEKGKTLTIETKGNEEAIAQLKELGYEVRKKDEKHVEIVSQGAEQAQASLAQLAGTFIPAKVVQIDANAADAFAKIDGVNVVKIDGKTAYVYGNSNDAQAKIDGVIRKGIPGKTTVIGANAGGFWSAWTAIQLQQSITKTVDIITRTFSVDGGKKFTGGMVTPFYQGGKVQNFAAGGFPSGLYQGVVGGIPKAGLDGKTHIFAEKELGVPWEVYLSGHPSYRERNIGLALEALKRMAFPVIPATALGGVRQFAAGGGITPSPTPAPAAAPVPIRSRFERRQRTDGPLVGTAIFGEGTTRNDLAEFEEALDRIQRS